MDGEADLPVQASTSARNIIRRAAPTQSSTSSSSSSPPGLLLRQVQAAFKRHRPLELPGAKKSNDLRPRRVVAPARNVGPSDGDLKRSRDMPSSDRLSKKIQDDEAMMPPSFSGTITKSFDESFNAFDARMDQASCDIDWKEKDPPPNNVEPQGDSFRKVQFSVQENATSQGPYGRVATESGNLSSHFSSLALTETEFNGTSQVEVSTIINPDIQHQKLQILESDGTCKSNISMPTSLAKRMATVQDQPHQFRNFLNQPATQSSVAGLSCVTTTSAPMLSSTTYDSRLNHEEKGHVAVKTLGDSSSQPVRQENVAQGPTPSFMTTSEMVIDEPALGPHVSSRVSGKSGDNKANVYKEELHTLERESVLRYNAASHDDKPLQAAANVVSTVQSRVPVSGDSSLTTKLEPAHPGKQEKATNRTGASVPRKRNYDPDLFFKVNGKLYQRLGKIGSGGSSEVHKVISSDCTIYALKKIKLKGRDYATAYGFCQEIEYLNRLKGKNNIIQLIDYEVTDKTLLNEVSSGSMNKDGRVKEDGYIYMVLEYGEIDLAHMLSQKWKEMESSGQTIDENWLRFYWQQILQAVNTIHEERIVHSDLKPANFLLVKGSLKLIDFGIAKAIMSDTTNIQRDSQVGTLSYMSPEAFMCNESDTNGNVIKCGRPSDIWSLGCILYQMVYGRTPFSEYKTFWSKFKVITDPNHEIIYEPISNPWLLDIMKKCLAWDRNERWRIPQLLTHPFLVPPVQSQAPSHQSRGHTLVELIVGSCADNGDASALCSQLKELMEEPVALSDMESLASPGNLCSLLSKISKLCLQLQEHFLFPSVQSRASSSFGSGCTLVQLIAGSCADNRDASALCSRLKELMEEPLALLDRGSFVSPDQLCSLLSKMSNLCLELQEHFVVSRRR